MTPAKISKVTISNSNYIGLIVISVELVSCPGFSWTLVTPLFLPGLQSRPAEEEGLVESKQTVMTELLAPSLFPSSASDDDMGSIPTNGTCMYVSVPASQLRSQEAIFSFQPFG